MSRRTIVASALVLVFAAAPFPTSAHRASEPAVVPGAMKTAEPAAPIPANHAFAKITNGMSEVDVRKILGEPTNSKDYVSGKAWVPWSSENSRQEWTYKGKGLITFSRNKYSGSLKVIKVTYDPSK